MAQKISVVTPNYNGKALLAKNLPKVLKNCQGCEVIIVDDGSTDGSAAFIRKNFKQVKLIVNAQNQGFAKSVNLGCTAASGDLVLLLNSDTTPRTNFLKLAVKHFEQISDLFAVGLADYSHEGSKIVVRGRGGAGFKNGFVSHFAAKPQFGKTLWVSGGSGLFDRKKFLELDGFDPVFAPFYWEDIDLCYRAQKRGLRCLFEPRSQVDHFHEEGAIIKTYSPFLVRTVSYKNQFLFFWKNITDYVMICQHLSWLPYHFIKAIVSGDLAFLAGFIWALFKVPKLIFNYSLDITHYSLTDQEIIGKFEKS